MRLKPRSSAASDAVPKRHKLATVPNANPPREEIDTDRLIYERVRLGIMSALAVRSEVTFTELKSLFDVSDGNLSAHARKLESAAYLTSTKSFEARRPKTVYRITDKGRHALHRYLDHVEAVIKATRR